MFDRPEFNDRALLVAMETPQHPEVDINELASLSEAAGYQCVESMSGVLRQVNSRYFFGTGKVDGLRDQLADNDCRLIIIDNLLSPAQERNLEKTLKCRILGRTELILEIFAQRARSFEGKLQVRLAQLRHAATRLVGGWTHLERQRGGIGVRGGPGETQLEVDRRIINKRIQTLQKRLDKVALSRSQSRVARRKANLPTVALVGYTNAGKSTLFNALTGADAYAAAQLFATLDPTLRRLRIAGIGDVIATDTVGFVSRLPHELVAAFHATLQETREAALLLHVIDSADEQWEERRQQVLAVLQEIGADDVPVLNVFNKIDVTGQDPELMRDSREIIRGVRVSAMKRQGFDLLEQAIAERLAYIQKEVWLSLPMASSGRLRNQCYKTMTVLGEKVDDQGQWLQLRVRAARSRLERFCQEVGVEVSE